MTKTKEELNELKKEYEILNNKLQELSEDELNYVVGGFESAVDKPSTNFAPHLYDGDVVNKETFNKKF